MLKATCENVAYLSRKSFPVEGVLRSAVIFASKVHMELFECERVIPQGTPSKCSSTLFLVNRKSRSMAIVLESPSYQASRVVELHCQRSIAFTFHLACIDVNWGLAVMTAIFPFLGPVLRTQHYSRKNSRKTAVLCRVENTYQFPTKFLSTSQRGIIRSARTLIRGFFAFDLPLTVIR